MLPLPPRDGRPGFAFRAKTQRLACSPRSWQAAFTFTVAFSKRGHHMPRGLRNSFNVRDRGEDKAPWYVGWYESDGLARRNNAGIGFQGKKAERGGG